MHEDQERGLAEGVDPAAEFPQEFFDTSEQDFYHYEDPTSYDYLSIPGAFHHEFSDHDLDYDEDLDDYIRRHDFDGSHTFDDM